MLERYKAFLRKYGMVGLGVSFAVSGVSLASLYTALRLGVDLSGPVNSVLAWLHLSNWKVGERSSAVVAMLAIHKLLMPVRYSIVFAVTPSVQRALERWRASR